MARLRYDNSVGTLAAGGLGGLVTDTTINFQTAPSFATLAAGDYIALVLDPPGAAPNGNYEVVYLTGYVAGATSGTISRGQEGTARVAHAAGATWLCGPTSNDSMQYRGLYSGAVTYEMGDIVTYTDGLDYIATAYNPGAPVTSHAEVATLDAAHYALNGTATISAGTLQLMNSQFNDRGNAIASTAVYDLDGFTATVKWSSIGGADAGAIMMLDAAQETNAALGSASDGAGFNNLAGVGFILDSFVPYYSLRYYATPGGAVNEVKISNPLNVQKIVANIIYTVNFRAVGGGNYLCTLWATQGAVDTYAYAPVLSAIVPVPGSSATGWRFGVGAGAGGATGVWAVSSVSASNVTTGWHRMNGRTP